MSATRVFLIFFVFVSILHGQVGRTVDKDSIHQLQKTAEEFFQEGKLNQALSHGQRALRYASFIEHDSLKAKSHHILGNVYILMNYEILAFENYEKAIVFYKETDDNKSLMKIFNAIGNYYLQNGSYTKAEEQLKRSIQLSKKFPNDFNSILSVYSIGKLYLEQQAYTKAIDCFERVIEFSTNDPHYNTKSNLLPKAHYNNGKAFLVQGNLEAAIKQFETVISLCDFVNYDHAKLLAFVYESLAEIYAVKGMKEEELVALEKHIHYYKIYVEQKKESALSEIILKYGIDQYEDRLEAIETEQEEKEIYIQNYKRLTTILIVILIILVILTGIFYLNQRARIRTNALLSKQNQQLFEAKKQIENVSKIRSNFFSLISHELRTPLYAIIGMTNLLLLEKPEKYQERYLKSLKFSGEHLLAIINNILQMNKIEASKMKAVEENIDVHKSVKNVITLVSFLVKENRNTIEVKIDKQIPKVLLGDSLKISQILFNLLDNAVRYNMESNIRLKINQVAETLETVTLRFSIKDNGLGIPQQKKHVVSENLEKGIILREDNGYLDLGLGLTTVNNLLKVLKSKLHLRSVLHKGSEFYFELELRKVETSEAVEETFENKDYNLDGLNILIVDDNAVNGLLTQKILERQNIQTKVVHNGFLALDIIEKQDFDLILMDMFMPKLNGIQTIQKIRENNNDIPIILLTAMEISDAYAKVVDTKISGVISKPFEPEMLYDKINYVIHRSSEE